MSLNWREINLVLDELPLEGAHIQQVVQPDFRNVFLQMYQPSNPFWLRVCLETGRTRLHKSAPPVGKPKTRQRFAQLLHSRVKGGKIVSARQVNGDRIVRLDVRALIFDVSHVGSRIIIISKINKRSRGIRFMGGL